MALFGGGKKETNTTHETTNVNVNNATIITQGSKITGNFSSNDTLHVDGEIDGDITVDNMVVVGKSGVVQGNIKAQKVICSGKIDGFIECESIEVLQNAEVSYKLIANIVIINGKYEGEIIGKNVLVDTYGTVGNKIQAKEIVIKGSFAGDLACELLTTKPSGKIKGNMFVKNILNEGGLVEGAIGQYKDMFASQVKEITNKPEDEEKAEAQDSNKDDNIQDVEIEEK